MLGLLAFAGFLAAAARLAARLSVEARLGAEERAVLSAIAPMLLLQIPVLFYNTDLSAVPQMQLLLMLMVGQALYSARHPAHPRSNADGNTGLQQRAVGYIRSGPAKASQP